MKGLNRCFFIGNLAADPELRYSSGGMSIATFRIGVTQKFKDKEVTEWVRCTAFDKLAQVIEKYVKKGDPVHVQAYLKQSKSEKDGETRYYTDFIVNDLIMLSNKKSEGRELSPAPGVSFNDDDDIPF